jgi:hypothetical protein
MTEDDVRLAATLIFYRAALDRHIEGLSAAIGDDTAYAEVFVTVRKEGSEAPLHHEAPFRLPTGIAHEGLVAMRRSVDRYLRKLKIKPKPEPNGENPA